MFGHMLEAFKVWTSYDTNAFYNFCTNHIESSERKALFKNKSIENYCYKHDGPDASTERDQPCGRYRKTFFIQNVFKKQHSKLNSNKYNNFCLTLVFNEACSQSKIVATRSATSQNNFVKCVFQTAWSCLSVNVNVNAVNDYWVE